jgi:hypothetical protein
MYRLYFLVGLGLLWSLSSPAQFMGQPAPPNDFCGKAVPIRVGERLSGFSNADATISLEFERPQTFEATCVQTIENDVWFKFQAEAGYEWYEVEIVSGFCTTPAGLQAMLIEADGCSANKFLYRGCSNKINTDTIKLYLQAPKPGQNYYLWIDGYDGTICEFDVALKGRKQILPDDYRFLRFDYDLATEPSFSPEDLRTAFNNNCTTLQWAADMQDDAALFIVELLPDLPDLDEGSKYARVIGFVDAHNFVGAGRSEYVFSDYLTPYQQGKTYHYRIVRVDGEGKRHISETLAVRAQMVESFEVGEVKPATEPHKFIVHYINRKKGQRYDISVANMKGEQVKHMVLDKEPLRDGTVTIDMSSLPAGEYYFVMSNGKEAFKKLFTYNK